MNKAYASQGSAMPRSAKLIKSGKRKFPKLIFGRNNNSIQDEAEDVLIDHQRGVSLGDHPERSISFVLSFASGGRIVETTRYDPKTDRRTTSLYVITPDQELGEAIERIIALEGLR